MIKTGRYYWVESNIATVKTLNQLRAMGIIGHVSSHPNVYTGVPNYSGTNKGKYSIVLMAYAYNMTHDRVDEDVVYTDVELWRAKEIKYPEIASNEASLLVGDVMSATLGSNYHYKLGHLPLMTALYVKSWLPTPIDHNLVCSPDIAGEPDPDDWRRRLHTVSQQQDVFDAAFSAINLITTIRANREAVVFAAVTVDEVIGA